MSKRLEAIQRYASHPWLSRVYAKLSADELSVIETFIQANDSLDKGAFEKAVNRLFVDRPKTKHWTSVCELLTCANSS